MLLLECITYPTREPPEKRQAEQSKLDKGFLTNPSHISLANTANLALQPRLLQLM